MADPNGVRCYLVPSQEAFWRWDDAGEVVCWQDGTTIAFRAELLGVARRLAPQGLPPFDAIILLFVASRQQLEQLEGDPGSMRIDSPRHAPLLKEVLASLHQLSQLPADLRTSQDAREEMADLVFLGARHRLAPAFSDEVVAQLERGIPEEWHASRTLAAQFTGRLVLESLQSGAKRCDEATLRLRLRTGLSWLPSTAGVQSPTWEPIRGLLRELETDEEPTLRGIARLARRLLAAVSLPRRILDRDDLCVGGVSDISNRGRVEQLLISELAHDDLTLAVRMATNEALYWRREAPPRTPPRSRLLLLDAGLRTWGLPRLFGTAVAMALAASDRFAAVQAFRADGSSLAPVDLATRTGLIAQLEGISADLHPGAALRELACQARLVQSGFTPAEVILVTTYDTVADWSFQQVMLEGEMLPIQIAAVDRDGNLAWDLFSSRGKKTVRAAKLDLSDLTAGRKPSSVPMSSSSDALPTIFRWRPFPLRLADKHDASRMWPLDCGIIQVTRDRRLLLWEKEAAPAPGFGALQICDELPSARLLWCGKDELADDLLVVVGNTHAGKLWLIRADTSAHHCTITQMNVGRAPVLSVSAHRNRLFVRGATGVDVLEIPAGQLCGTLELKGLRWRGGRFFVTAQGQWQALSANGLSAAFAPVFGAEDQRQFNTVALFETDGIEGPIALTSHGDLFFTATEKTWPLPLAMDRSCKPYSPAVLLHVSRRGRRILVRAGNRHDPPRSFRIDLGNSPEEVRAAALELQQPQLNSRDGLINYVEPEIEQLRRPPNKRRHFQRIGVSSTELLALQGRHGTWFVILLRGNHIYIEEATFSPPSITSVAVFDHWLPQARDGCRLKLATWPGKGRAVLDSRGMLHLHSDEQRIPQVTLVLSDLLVSGWCADGRMWGDPYFCGKRERLSDPATIYRETIQAFVRGLGK